MARENVRFTRYYYQVRGGGNWRVHQKAWAYNSGSVGQDALPGPLHLLVQIVAIPPKILKWPENKKPNFYSPPPPTHTHISAQAQYTKDRYLKKCLLSEVITPITLKHKNFPLIPRKNISDPPTPYPLPLCVLYHNISRQINGGSRGIQGVRFEPKLFHFHEEFSEKLSGKVRTPPPPSLSMKIWTPIKKSRIRTCWSAKQAHIAAQHWFNPIHWSNVESRLCACLVITGIYSESPQEMG